jgi:CheY-like chemotaxis protein
MMPNTADPDPRVGTDVAGYRIEERIGRGGMGVVYRAHHLALGREAAIKIVVPELAADEGFRERFMREARIAATLTHPNVVTVYDAGEEDDELYIAMQLVEGQDLAAVLRTEGRLRPFRALDVSRQVAAALDAAHAAGLVHRDVKPANVLLDGRKAYLTDFGLTKGPEAGPTKVGEVVGTVHYAAPEQIEGGAVDSRADVYALGCLLFHLLSGQVPYPRDSEVAVMYAHVQDPPPRLSEVLEGMPPPLDAVLARAMAKDPARRFHTCEELVAAARAMIDRAGPLADALRPRRVVPAGGDSADMPTTVGVPAVPTPVPGKPAAQGPLVLVGGVDAASRAVARVALDRCELVDAGEGDLLEVARARRPDLVLLGWGANGDTAVATAAALRGDARTRETPIVLVVGWQQQDSRVVRAAGADEWIAAPFSPLQLRVKLRKLLGTEAVGA